MEVQPDFKELLALFNDHRVSYLIVGGYALAFHGAPRFTGDLDIFIKPDHENASRIVAALDAFGFASLGLTESDFEQPDQVIQLGVAPVRIPYHNNYRGFLGRRLCRESCFKLWRCTRTLLWPPAIRFE